MHVVLCLVIISHILYHNYISPVCSVLKGALWGVTGHSRIKVEAKAKVRRLKDYWRTVVGAKMVGPEGVKTA